MALQNIVYFLTVLLFTLPESSKGINIESRIIGGTLADPNEFPYDAGILKDGTLICGGSIIGKRTILTAATCLKDWDWDIICDLTVSVGSNQWRRGQIFHVSQAIPHPRWNRILNFLTWRYDIALIILTHDITFGPGISKVNLPSTNLPLAPTPATVSGWGTTVASWNAPSPDLYYLNVEALPPNNCREILGWIITAWLGFSNEQTCTQPSSSQGICHRDPGDPLVITGDIQIGVASFALWGCASGNPDIYVKVYSNLNFINSHLQ